MSSDGAAAGDPATGVTSASHDSLNTSPPAPLDSSVVSFITEQFASLGRMVTGEMAALREAHGKALKREEAYRLRQEKRLERQEAILKAQETTLKSQEAILKTQEATLKTQEATLKAQEAARIADRRASDRKLLELCQRSERMHEALCNLDFLNRLALCSDIRVPELHTIHSRRYNFLDMKSEMRESLGAIINTCFPRVRGRRGSDNCGSAAGLTRGFEADGIMFFCEAGPEHEDQTEHLLGSTDIFLNSCLDDLERQRLASPSASATASEALLQSSPTSFAVMESTVSDLRRQDNMTRKMLQLERILVGLCVIYVPDARTSLMTLGEEARVHYAQFVPDRLRAAIGVERKSCGDLGIDDLKALIHTHQLAPKIPAIMKLIKKGHFYVLAH